MNFPILRILVWLGCCWLLPIVPSTYSAEVDTEPHRFSTLFTAQDVRDQLDRAEGRDAAIRWCRETGVSKVYLEVFRDGYRADRAALLQANEHFLAAGFVVHGCVTPTQVGKPSTGWRPISCYTDAATQQQIQDIFVFAAELFDVIMIDDFWFTDCECTACQQAKGERDWSSYRLELMDRVTRESVIAPARRTHPEIRLIIKYPEWYDMFHVRGYDVARGPALFDATWIGTETRDPDNDRWGRKPQYGGYWLGRWAHAFSHGKLHGGWFYPLGTSPATYVEQARQTVLAQCPESMLFCYGALHHELGPSDIEAFRREREGLLELARFVSNELPRGAGSYKPPHSPGGDDQYIFNFLGMLGIPLTADVQFPSAAPALVITEHAVADTALSTELVDYVQQGKPILVTSSAWRRLPPETQAALERAHAVQLPLVVGAKTHYGVLDSVRQLAAMSPADIDALRRPILTSLGIRFSAPTNVALYLYGDDKFVVENFRDDAVTVRIGQQPARGLAAQVVLPPDAQVRLDIESDPTTIVLPPRTLVALETTAAGGLKVKE